jgi:hypothetical protein
MRRTIREFCVLWDSEQGLPMGLLDAAIMLRDDDTFRSTATRKQRPIEQKASYRFVYKDQGRTGRRENGGCTLFLNTPASLVPGAA